MAGTVVFVHGGWSGSWTWQDVTRELKERGIASVAVDLPSCTAEDAAIDFRDDAQHVRGVIDDVDGPVVLVGNSYGGLVITEAASGHASVKRLVYIAALMPTVGQTVLEALGPPNPALQSAIKFRDDGLLDVDVEIELKIAMQQAPEHAKEQLRKHVAKAMSFGTDQTASVSTAAWETIPSTFVVCAEDGVMSPDYQRELAKQATEVVEWPSDHAPQHSHPSDVADLLEKLTNEVG